MLRRIARRGIPVLAALLGLLAAFVAPPAHAADIGVHDLETASVPAGYRQFALGSDGLDFDSIEWDDGAWMTYRFHGVVYRYPVKPDAGLAIPNVGKWTDEDGTTRQIDMRLSVKEGDVIAFLPRKGRLWWRTVHTGKEAGAVPYSDEVRSIWGTFTPADGRYGATMTASFTYHDTGESVPDMFKGVVGFNDLDGRDDQPDLVTGERYTPRVNEPEDVDAKTGLAGAAGIGAVMLAVGLPPLHWTCGRQRVVRHTTDPYRPVE